MSFERIAIKTVELGIELLCDNLPLNDVDIIQKKMSTLTIRQMIENNFIFGLFDEITSLNAEIEYERKNYILSCFDYDGLNSDDIMIYRDIDGIERLEERYSMLKKFAIEYIFLMF